MTASMKELKQRREQLVTRARKILDEAKEENRQFSTTERETLDGLDAEVETLTRQIDRAEAEAAKHSLPGRGLPNENGGGYLTLSHGQRLADLLPATPTRDTLSFGKAIVGLVTNRWEGREAERLAVQGGTTGGYATSPELSARIIDLARSKSVVLAAGARVQPMQTSEYLMATLTQDPVAYWRAETALITESDPVFGQKRMRAKTCAVLTPISIELAEDAPNAADLIEQAITSALALKLDFACLEGDGAAEQPMGIFNETGTNSIAVSTLVSWDAIARAVAEIEIDNGTPNALITHPRTMGHLDRAKTGDGLWLGASPASSKLKMLASSQISTTQGSGTDSWAVVGDWSKFVVGLRTQITFELFRSGYTTTTGDAVSKMLIWLRAYLRADTLVEQPTHFCKLTGLSSS